MSEPVSIRTAAEEDVPQILSVMSAALGENALLKRTEEMFSWKHFDNPFGPSIILVAEIDGRIAGVRAFMRWVLETSQGSTLSCVRAVDTATHPEFQGRGVFRALTLSAIEEARSQGVDLIFNTPNEKSAPGYLKMGWREVGFMGPLVRPRLGRAVRPDSQGLVRLSEILPRDVSPALELDLDRPPLGLRTPRSFEYQKWRFVQHPSARYGWADDGTGQGAVVRASVRRGRPELLIAELTGGTRSLRRLARSHRARYMAASFSRVGPEWRAARRAGMFAPPFLHGLRLVANPLHDLDVDVFDLASWDFSLGDLELL